MGDQINPADYSVKLWIDNTDVVNRGRKKCGDYLKAPMVLDYDLWTEMEMLQSRIKINLHWNKLTPTYRYDNTNRS